MEERSPYPVTEIPHLSTRIPYTVTKGNDTFEKGYHLEIIDDTHIVCKELPTLFNLNCPHYPDRSILAGFEVQVDLHALYEKLHLLEQGINEIRRYVEENPFAS
jgi:hypothetical protein